tara:strand:+ start:4706 stop:5143 length:438 start_codon:yes stop_codon:yes gene_type:complete
MRAFDYRNRTALRKYTEHLEVSSLHFVGEYGDFAAKAEMVQMSSTGMLLRIERKDMDKKFKRKFDLSDIVGEQLYLCIDAMDLEVDGVVTRIHSPAKNVFDIAIDYSAGAPEYWRECLVDMIPTEGEEEEEFFNPFVNDDDEWDD